MRRLTLALLGLALLGAATAAWAAGPPAIAIPALASPAVSPAFAPPVDPVLGPVLSRAQPIASFTCTSPPTTTCNSCLYFGIRSSYQCTTFCANGVFHRSCNTCGQGCIN